MENYLVLDKTTLTGIKGIYTSTEELLEGIEVVILQNNKVQVGKTNILSHSYTEEWTKVEILRDIERNYLKRIECLLKIGIYKIKRVS